MTDNSLNHKAERPIGVIVAMRKEFDLLLPHMEGPAEEVADGLTFYSGTIAGKRIVAMQCGIGKVNAAIAADTFIRLFNPLFVVNTGVAGGTGAGAGVLDIVVADEIAYHDVWCGPGTVPGQAADCPQRFTSDSRLLALIPDGAADGRVRHGLIASGDIFVSRREEVEHIASIYPGVKAVDMESAAIAHVCHRRGVPFYCMRVVSDTPGAADNISQYETFWDDAPRSTFEVLLSLIEAVNTADFI